MEEKIIWTSLAFSDLKNVYDYIAADSESYANKLIEEIENRIQLLVLQPKLGRIVPEKDDNAIREIIAGNYRIMYAIDKLPFIYIYRIIHRSQNFK